MRYRTISHVHSMFRLFVLLFVVLAATGYAGAQTLAFTPGQYKVYAGNPLPPGNKGPSLSPATFTGTAANLVLGGPGNMVFDSAGNLYIMDTGNAIVRVVAASNNPIPALLPGTKVQAGHVYTVAGTTNGTGSTIPPGCVDVQGNGCPATEASFVFDYGIAVDKNGNVYIPDASNSQIRVVYGGTGSLPGITNPRQGYMYALTNQQNDHSGEISGENGPAVSATPTDPVSIAVDSNGNIFFNDGYSTDIHFIYSGGNLPSNFFPAGVTPTQGHFYQLTNGFGIGCTATTGVCDGYPIGEAYFSNTPDYIAFDGSDNLYVFDQADAEVRAVFVGGKLPGLDSSSLTVGYIYAIAGNGQFGPATLGGAALQSPLTLAGQGGGGYAGFTLDPAGDFYFSAQGSQSQSIQSIYKVDTSGILTNVFGGTAQCANTITTGSSAPPLDAQLEGCSSLSITDTNTNGLAVDANGNLFIADYSNSGSHVVMESNMSTSTIAYTDTAGLPIVNPTLTVSNIGTQALQLSNIVFTGPFSQVATGGSNDCSASTNLASGEDCIIGLNFTPPTPGQMSGTLTIASNATNAVSGTNTNVMTFSAIVAQATSSTKVTAIPGGSVLSNAGQSVTLTAVVAPEYQDTLIPSGTVTFMDGSTTLGTATLSGPTATFTVSAFAAGTHSISAVYSGDTNFLASTASPYAVVVAPASSPVAVVSITSSASSVNGGQSVIFTATASSFSGTGTPTGTISFQSGANLLPNSQMVLNNGTASFTTTLPAGSNQISAVYSGDSHFGANASAPVTVQVNSSGLIQVNPGVISLVTGSYFTNSGAAPASGSAANAAQFSPSGLAVDSYGNTYTFGPSVAGIYNGSSIFVTASGNGPIPGISNPKKGLIYLLGSATACANSGISACGDGGPVSQAYFTASGAMAIDALNNIYVSDNGEIRKISVATGNVTNLGGSYGQSGDTGDNGPASAAQLVASSIFADANGNVYFADSYDRVVRRIDGQTGIITTIAGQTPAFAGDPKSCNTLPCGDGGQATAATLIGPVGIFVDQASNVYIGDYGNVSGANPGVVRKIDGQTGIISLYAGMYTSPNLTYYNVCDPQEQMPCGDGGPATSASINNISAMTGDQSGNIYIADNSLIVVRQINAKTGIINTIAGNLADAGNSFDPFSNKCANSNHPLAGSAPCGDGTAATSAFLNNPTALAVDSQGNFYIADGGFSSGTDTIRMVSGSTTTLDYGSESLGSLTGNNILLTNLGSQPVDITGLTIPINFPQQATGTSDCSASTTLAAGAFCQLDLAFFPTETGAVTQTATIASNSTNATNGVNTITLIGTGSAAGGTQKQNITFNAPVGPFYAGQQIPLTATSDAQAQPALQVEYLVTAGSAEILNNNTASATLKIIGAGSVAVTAYQFGNSTYAPATPVTVTLMATTPILTFTPTLPSITVGTSLPSYNSTSNYTVAGFVGSDTASVITGQPLISVLDSSGNTIAPGTVLNAGSYTVSIALGTLNFPSYYQPQYVQGTLNVTGSNKQTITFNALPTNITYAGATNYTLNAVAYDATTGKADGESITYTATGPATVAGNVLTITGAGTVNVTALQAGDSTYASVSAAQTIQVAKASLTITAVSVTYAQGVPLPSFTSASSYAITGLLPGDNVFAVTGQPLLSIVDTNGLAGTAGSILSPGSTPPAGNYTLSISTGQLAAANYNFTFVNGTLTVSSGTPQTISFGPIPSVVYGAAPITLGASSSATALSVSYSASPSNLVSLSGNTLTILGAGTITITASQGGNNTYAPAKPVQQTLVVAPATLTVTAANATRLTNTLNPAFNYTLSGFVNNDIAGSSVSGTPALSTTATVTSPIGQYPINFVISPTTGLTGNLTSTNYAFNFVPGTLNVTSGGPIPDYSITATPQAVTVVQGQTVQVQISLLPVNYYQGLVNLSCGSLPANMTCTFSPASLTATGNNALVSSTLTINTNPSSPIVGQVRTPGSPSIFTAAFFWLPGGLAGLLLFISRRKINWDRRITYLAIFMLLLSVTGGLTACGGGSASGGSNLAPTGPSTFTVTAADAAGSVTHNLPISITVR